MTDEYDEIPEEMVRFVEEAVRKALDCQDAREFLAWAAKQQLPVPGGGPAGGLASKALGVLSARAIWNVVPLPGNGYRPELLPEWSRNGPCPCGSGLKLKR